MNKVIIILTTIVLAATACTKDKNTQLKELKAERDQLNAQITKLEKELTQNGDLKKHVNKTYVTTKKINPVVFRHFVEVKGSVESDNNIFVPAEQPGIVTNVLVKEGQMVKKGQLMAKIDDDIIERQIGQLETNLELATTVYERQKRLWEKEIGSEIEYLQAKTNKESAEKQLKVLQKQLEMTRIESPINGMVDEIIIKEGEMAAAGKSGIRVVGTGKLKIKANLSEAYFGEVTKGDTAIVAIPALNADFERPIFAVARAIDAGNRTFGIDIRPPHKLDISPNMLAVVIVNDYTNRNAITVPVNVVQTDNKGEFLFVAKKQGDKWVAERRSVKVNKNYKGQAEIISGVNAGDQIITAGYQDVANGQVITLEQ